MKKKIKIYFVSYYGYDTDGYQISWGHSTISISDRSLSLDERISFAMNESLKREKKSNENVMKIHFIAFNRIN